MWEYISNYTFAAVPKCACLYVCLCLCFYTIVCVLPSVHMARHGAPAEHCCISASLGLSLRSSKRPDPAGSGLGTENRKNGEREKEGRRKQDSVLKSRR